MQESSNKNMIATFTNNSATQPTKSVM